MQMLFILILAGVGGWLIWERGDMTKQLETSKAEVAELTKKVEDSQKNVTMLLTDLAKANPGQAAIAAKRIDANLGAPAGSANSAARLVPAVSPMEARRNKGGTLLDATNTTPSGRR